jgi:4-amino-4-deoxy-L-arabinose transferase-like glycosyltransferase
VGILLLARDRRPSEQQLTPEEQDRQFLASVVLAGFVARVLIAAAITRFGLHLVIAPDEHTFHANGLQFSKWLSGESPYRVGVRFTRSLQVGYYYLIGTLYYLFGVTRFLPILVNCACGALMAIPVFRMARELGGPAAARPAAVLVTFFPSLVLWSTLLIRDTIVILTILWIMWVVMDLRRQFSLFRLIQFLLLLMLLGTFRQYLFILVAASAVASFTVGRAGRTAKSLVVGVLVIVGLLAVVKVAGFGVWELERASLHHLNLRRQFNSLGSTTGAIAPEVDITEPVNALTYLPVGMFYFLGSPFPWQVLSTSQVMALPDVFVWYLLLPPIFMGLVHTIRTRFRDASMLIITMAVITILYSLVEGNVGIIFRHRAQVIAPLMVMAGIGLAARRAKKAEKEAALKAAAAGAAA